MASKCKYDDDILINLGFMSVRCVVRIYFQETFQDNLPTVLPCGECQSSLTLIAAQVQCYYRAARAGSW